MKFIDVALSSWTPKINPYLFRKSPRSELGRAVEYEDLFDFFTLIYDAFWSADGTKIVLVCPNFLNLEDDLGAAVFTEVPSGRKCPVEVVKTGPISTMMISVSPGTVAARLNFSLGEYLIAPQPSFCRELAGERVIMTISKNNALHWIRDWVYFYVKMHGCTGIVFYDNNSDSYSKYDIRAAMETVPGLKVAAIIDAPFPYGSPPSLFGEHDSRYLPRGLLEHFRQRFGSLAASVMHVDIDELVMSENNYESVFAAAEGSSTGYISFEGKWVERVNETGTELPLADIRHSSFPYVAAGGGRRSAVKWAIAPKRLNPRSFWTTHRVYHASPDHAVSERFKHRHFMGLKTPNTDPTRDRSKDLTYEKVDPQRHEQDPILVDQLAKCFGAAEYQRLPAVPPFAEPDEPDVCRRLAGKHFAARDYEGAANWTKRAISLNPNIPSYHQYLSKCFTLLGRPREAAAASKAAEKLRSASPKFRVGAARALQRARDLEGAERALLEVIEEFPDYAEGYLRYGEVLSALDRPYEAEATFRHAVQMGLEGAEPLWRWAVELQRCGCYADAAGIYRYLCDFQAFDDRVKGFMGLSFCLERQRQYDEAETVLRNALVSLDGHERLTGRARREFEQAIERIRSASKLRPMAKPAA